MPTTYTIFCAILGETTSFSVDIASNKTVDQLKKKIKEEKPNRFAGVDADELALYDVNISGSKEARIEELKTMADNFGQREELDALRELTQIYSTAPPKHTIHIIVQPPHTVQKHGLPSAGEKHGRSEDDADSEPAAKRKQGPRHSGSEPVEPTPPMQQEASALHAKAWGKPWPQSEGTIDKIEISDETGSVDDDEFHGLADKLDIPPYFEYRYLKEIRSLKSALGTSLGRDEEDVIVVREEYEMLRLGLEDYAKDYDSIVVTGHPGIGKSTFLFYLLLYRLERKLPTAVQLNVEYYFIFDEQGAIVHPLPHHDLRLAKCWALTDSNQDVLQPCRIFTSLAKLVILASSPKPERWKEWIKQTGGRCIISDLPSVPEIAAIAKELRERQIQLEKQLLYDPSSTLSLVRKWGPSTRNILRTMKCAALKDVDLIEAEAGSAAESICKNPSVILQGSLDLMPQSQGSSVIFLRRTPKGTVKSDKGKRFIPTPHLRALFEEQRRQMANRESLQLFCALSSHALTRSAAGWAHEKSIHERLGMGGADLSIFQGPTEKHMRPSTRLLPGTLAGLREAGHNDSFYWMPSVVNFPGVDGVLGDTDGHVYTIQATIASEHASPEQGIKKVWDQFRSEIRTRRTWHFVVIADTKETADAYGNKFSKDMRKFTLGGVQVQVWACVLVRDGL